MFNFTLRPSFALLFLFMWNCGAWIAIAILVYANQRGFYDGVICGAVIIQAIYGVIKTCRQFFRLPVS
ncbi:hypothetical protein APU11_13230 [Enterobacter sp. 50793107]|nr:hypothetical protein APU11_13230 [Enterobacter sp. 50793107]KTH24865.1 hypothetical protein ASV29_14525 [Enterobacter cloacae subsp. cloacae]PCM68946.1 hypothetical protein CP904_26670 [Enterobacter cloacae]KTH27666.1 hypothetical protein ASV28_14520 [Enterobacter cloacae subsp. cloacae]PDQ12867.1 hypothetical protein CKK21_22575 [Enterobacter cloacae]